MRREANARHDTARSRKLAGVDSSVYWEYDVGQRVVTVEGFPGQVVAVNDGPLPGNETYEVELDNDMGGGDYHASELHPLNETVQPKNAAKEAESEHLASDDYPELADVLVQRPPLENAQAAAKEAYPVRPSRYGDPTPGSYGPWYVIEKGNPSNVIAGPFEEWASANGWRAANDWTFPERGEVVHENSIPAYEGDAYEREREQFHPDRPEWSRAASAEHLPVIQSEGGPVQEWVNKKLPERMRNRPGNQWSYDWCRFRRDSHCYYPRHLDQDATEQAGYPVWIPVDRGWCPRTTWESQEQCPVGQPGPNTGRPDARPDATVSWDDGGQRYVGQVRTPPFEFTASWRDVQRKAKRIKDTGGVRIISAPEKGTGNLRDIVANVNGDTSVYQTRLTRVPNGNAIAMWECGCAWASYSWGRSGRWKKYEGRMCSHALAVLYEAQAREGFWGEETISEDPREPSWMRDTEVVYEHDKPPLPEDMGFVSSREKLRPVETDAFLQAAPAVRIGAGLLRDSRDPAQVRAYFASLGVDPDEFLSKAGMAMPRFPVKYQGDIHEVVELVLGEVIFTDGTTAPVDQVEHPRYHPSLGLTASKESFNFDSPRAIPKATLCSEHAKPYTKLAQPTSEDPCEVCGATSWRGAKQAEATKTAAALTPEQMEQLAQIRDEARASYCPAGSLGGCFPASEMVADALGWEVVGGTYLDRDRTLKGRTVEELNAYDWDRDPEGLDDHTHAWNLLPDGTIVDVTAAQFSEGHDIRVVRPGDPDYDRYWMWPSYQEEFGHLTAMKTAQADVSEGAMVALRPPDHILDQLVERGVVTENYDNLHITVGYLGKAADIDSEAVHRAVQSFAQEAPQLRGRVGGYGTFHNGENVLWASFDIPGLDDWRAKLLDFLTGAGVSVAKDHSYTPHMTLAYSTDEPFTEVPDSAPEDDFILDEVTVAVAGDWTHYPLEGGSPRVQAEGSLDLSFDLIEGGGADIGYSGADLVVAVSTHEGVPVEVGYAALGPGGVQAVYTEDGWEDIKLLLRERALGLTTAQSRDTVDTSADQLCPVCGGDGLLDDGTRCYRCGGDGKVEAKLASGVSLSHSVEADFEGDEGVDRWEVMAEADGRVVGRLSIFTYDASWPSGPRAVVDYVEVDESYRRRGIATQMWSYARDHLGEVEHSEWQTDPGQAWSDAVGGPREETTSKLDEQPEPALPQTDGDEPEDSGQPDVDEDAMTTVGAAHASRSWLMNDSTSSNGNGGGRDMDMSDIAAQAQKFLSDPQSVKTAGKRFTPAEQRELVNEGPAEGERARNFDRLDITGTHYEQLEQMEDEDDDLGLLWLM